MPTDYGSDISCVADLDPRCAVSTGRRLLAEALVRRLITPRGRLIDDPNYGTDVTDWLNADVSPADVANMRAAIASECEKDERVESVKVTVTAPPRGIGAYQIEIQVTPVEDETFDLVVSVSDANVELLSVS